MGFFDDDSGDDDDDHQRTKKYPMMSLESLTASDDNDDDRQNNDHHSAAANKGSPTLNENVVTDNDKSAVVDFSTGTRTSKDSDVTAASVDQEQQQNLAEGDETVDPLDAYMNSLDQQKPGKPKHMTSMKDDHGGRLDIDNEDEATGHWEEPTASNPLKDIYDSVEDPPSSPTSDDLYSTFHKASNSSNEDRDVNIQLQQVHHDTITYPPFEKNFLDRQEQSNGNHPSSNRNTYEGQKWRKQNAILCTPPIDPVYEFAELRDVLPSQVVDWNVHNNLMKPTLVQSQTLGVALCGKDAIITASTGSGKTLAYLWPCVTHLTENSGMVDNRYVRDQDDSTASAAIALCDKKRRSRALVLVPTRELALQVEKVAKSLFSKLPLTALAITGGNMGRYQLSQKLQASKPHLVVATPGRLLDVLSAQQKNKEDWLLPNITFLVLDEADKMISLGFANQVTQILQNLRPDRQSLLTSATFDSRLQRRCQEWMHSPTRISVGKTGESSKHVLQHVVCLPTLDAKLNFLCRSLPTFTDVGRTLVFCRTREGVEKLASDLQLTNIPVETMHGDKHPVDRKAALKAFSQGDVKVLLATDVAGRGLDIPQVSTVINYDPAKNWDTHVHRIGRAGRMSSQEQQRQEGSAYTLLLPSNIDFAKALIRAYEREGRDVPDDVRAMVSRHHLSHTKRPYHSNGHDEQQDDLGNNNHPTGLGYYNESSSKKGRWS